jgi:hypothetical protein
MILGWIKYHHLQGAPSGILPVPTGSDDVVKLINPARSVLDHPPKVQAIGIDPTTPP